VIRGLLPYTTVLTVLAVLYVAWTLYSRQENAAEAERRAQQKLADANRRVVNAYGGDQLTILGFNAAEREVSAGGKVLMCYGVSNASQVKIEPGVEPIKPAISHCLEVFPKKTTTYTLTAEDAKEHAQSASLTITVR
jgi:hypothetical protein